MPKNQPTSKEALKVLKEACIRQATKPEEASTEPVYFIRTSQSNSCWELNCTARRRPGYATCKAHPQDGKVELSIYCISEHCLSLAKGCYDRDLPFADTRVPACDKCLPLVEEGFKREREWVDLHKPRSTSGEPQIVLPLAEPTPTPKVAPRVAPYSIQLTGANICRAKGCGYKREAGGFFCLPCGSSSPLPEIRQEGRNVRLCVERKCTRQSTKDEYIFICDLHKKEVLDAIGKEAAWYHEPTTPAPVEPVKRHVHRYSLDLFLPCCGAPHSVGGQCINRAGETFPIRCECGVSWAVDLEVVHDCKRRVVLRETSAPRFGGLDKGLDEPLKGGLK